MGISDLHSWTDDPEQAIHLQNTMRKRLVLAWDDRPVNTVGGIDAGYSGNSICAAIAVLSYPSLDPLYAVKGEAPLVFPYIPGLLAFRVIPAILAAWEKIAQKPDLLLVHGHGIAHPRGFGLASHLGLWLDIPCIGVAKSRLYGCQADVGPLRGDWSGLLDEAYPSQMIGAILRTRPNSRPLYVSPGHLIDLPHSLEFVLSCCGNYRIPEPIRVAHMAAVQTLQTWNAAG